MFGSDEARRTISLIGLIMLLLTVLGYVALGIVLKIEGYPGNQFVRWTPIAVSLRQHGHWFLVVPLIWTVYAVVSSHFDRGLLSESPALVIGIILVAVISLLFLFAVARPFTRPMLFHHSPSPVTGGDQLKGKTSGTEKRLNKGGSHGWLGNSADKRLDIGVGPAWQFIRGFA